MAEFLKVPGSVTVATAGAFADVVADALAQHEEVTLDLAEVGELDLSFLQIVTAARAHAAEQGKTVRLGAALPESLQHLLSRAGFLDGAASDDLAFWCAGDAR